METEFGYIVVAGRRYEHDIVVYPDGRVERRRKDLSKPEADLYAHTPLSLRELRYYLERVGGEPDCVVIGMGQSGRMRVTPEAKRVLDTLAQRGVRVIADLTPRIAERCAELESMCSKPLIVVHVTC